MLIFMRLYFLVTFCIPNFRFTNAIVLSMYLAFVNLMRSRLPYMQMEGTLCFRLSGRVPSDCALVSCLLLIPWSSRAVLLLVFGNTSYPSRGHTPTTSSMGLSPPRPPPSALIAQGQEPEKLGQPLCTRAPWTHSSLPDRSLLALPCLSFHVPWDVALPRLLGPLVTKSLLTDSRLLIPWLHQNSDFLLTHFIIKLLSLLISFWQTLWMSRPLGNVSSFTESNCFTEFTCRCLHLPDPIIWC